MSSHRQTGEIHDLRADHGGFQRGQSHRHWRAGTDGDSRIRNLASIETNDRRAHHHRDQLILARTDGKSPAQFLDPPSRERAREAGVMLLRRPEEGLWQWR